MIHIKDKVISKVDINQQNIPAGCYTARYNSFAGATTLEPTELIVDGLVDLNSPTFNNLINEMNLFFNSDVKKKFQDLGFVYKKSVLLHGKPGTGKTCLVVKVCNIFKDAVNNGIILFNPSLSSLEDIFSVVNKSTPILIILEEFDDIVKSDEQYLLSLLDGEMQRPNTMYLLTTNYINKIPARILRPGRVSNLIEVKYPDFKARLSYLRNKMAYKEEAELIAWTKDTDGLSIDDLKSSILMVECLNIEMAEAIDRLRSQSSIVNKQDINKLSVRL